MYRPIDIYILVEIVPHVDFTRLVGIYQTEENAIAAHDYFSQSFPNRLYKVQIAGCL